MPLPHDELALSGQVTLLRESPNSPVVYLIDKRHQHAQSTEENIENARLLVQAANVRLVGVEGYEGGREFDYLAGAYTDVEVQGEIRPETLIGDYPDFAQAIAEENATVVGVDCRGLCDHMEVQVADGQWQAAQIGIHPNQEARSRHFLATLFGERARLGLVGNLILNGGRNHNDHLAAMIANDQINAVAGTPATYIRLRAPSFPG
jgi:hypothetical protein